MRNQRENCLHGIRGGSASPGLRQVSSPDRGPLGFGVLPAVRGWVKGWFLRRYLSKLYQGELSNTPGRQWTAIAHPSEHLAESSLNVPQEGNGNL